MAVLIIFLLLVIYLLCCSIYCSYKKRISTFHGNAALAEKKISDGKKRNVDLVSVDNSTWFLRMKHKCSRWIESAMRPTMFVVSYIPSHTIRNFMYRYIFKVSLAKTAVIYYGAEIRAPWNLYIDEGAVIGDRAVLDARNGIYIGANVNFSTGVWVWTAQHDLNDMNFATVKGAVLIEKRAWVSCRTVILPGVLIGEGSVIAAGAVVTKSIEPYSICGGVPCKKIGERNSEINYTFTGKHLHFF